MPCGQDMTASCVMVLGKHAAAYHLTRTHAKCDTWSEVEEIDRRGRVLGDALDPVGGSVSGAAGVVAVV